MSKRIIRWAVALLALCPLVGTVAAEDPWRAVSNVPSADTPPTVTLGRPESLTGVPAIAAPADEYLGRGMAPVSYNETTERCYHRRPIRRPRFTRSTSRPNRVAPPPSGPLPAIPPPSDTPFNQGVITDHPLQQGFWDKCKEFFHWGGERASSSGRCPFQSDHCFDYFASPVTNPFLFEDPRALTELKPLFIYQGAPSTNPIFRGGNAEFYGLQARLALTERLSFTVNELGFVTLNPFNPSAGPPGLFSQSTGFAQVVLGPKYTFLRSEDWKTVMAGGLLFQIPAGSPKVFQDTGTLSLVPYLSAAKNFGLPAGWGSLNLMGTTGFSVSVDRQRSDYFYMSAHLDYNIANTNMFFPFLEMNWFHYTQGGLTNDPGFGFEGLGLVNFGSHNVGGRDFLSIAPGLRFKLNEHIQAGAAIAWPLLKQKEINDYQLVFDIIFRY